MKNRVQINSQFSKWKEFRKEVFRAPVQAQTSFDMLTGLKAMITTMTVFTSKTTQTGMRTSLSNTNKHNTLGKQMIW